MDYHRIIAEVPTVVGNFSSGLIFGWFVSRFVLSKKGKWTYLGNTEIQYHDSNNKITSKHYIHYYGRGKDFEERKVLDGNDKEVDYKITAHGYYQKQTIPWVKGADSIIASISNPSAELILYCKKKFNWKHTANGWERIEEGVLTDD